MTTTRSISIIGLLPSTPSTADLQEFWPYQNQHGDTSGIWGSAVFPLSNPSQITTSVGPNDVAKRAVDPAGTYSLVFDGNSIDLRIEGSFGSIEGSFTSSTVIQLDPGATIHAPPDPTASGWGPKNAITTLVFAPSVGAERQSGTGQASFTNADGTFSSAITPVQILLTTDTI